MPRPRIEYRTTSAEAFRMFKELHPDVNITWMQFNNILRTCNEMIMEHVMESGEKFKLPHGFGEISVHKWKPKRKRKIPDGREINNLPIDWKKTKELGKYVYHLNHHTGGYKCRWVWFPHDARFKNSNVFTFKPNRVPSRKLAQYLKLPNSPYIQIYRQWPKIR